MALLVMDTATEVLAVGLSDVLQDKQLPQQRPSLLLTSTSSVPRGHSVLLQPLIRQMLQSAEMEPKVLKAIAVGVGPGSYTGVRLGVSTAKAMAFALQIPLYSISTLHTIAASALAGTTDWPVRVISLLYARRQRAFGAVFEKQGDNWLRLSPDKVQLVSSWVEEYREIENHRGLCPTTVVHDFRPKYELGDTLFSFSPCVFVTLRESAGMIPQGLAHLWAAGEASEHTGDAIHLVEPGYALPVEAEAKLKEAKAHGGERG